MSSGITIRVSTEALIQGAETANHKIEEMRKLFEDIESAAKSVDRYWEGKGESAHVSAYTKRIPEVEEALARFRENAVDLLAMAGIYENAERQASGIPQALAGDVIV